MISEKRRYIDKNEILDKLPPLEDVFTFYGVELNPGGWCRCPLHNDHKPSLRVERNRNRWKCYVCNVGGNAIDLVQQMYGLEFLDTLKKLNEDFCLGVAEEELNQEALKRMEAKRVAMDEKKQQIAELEERHDLLCEQRRRMWQRCQEGEKEKVEIVATLDTILNNLEEEIEEVRNS